MDKYKRIWLKLMIFMIFIVPVFFAFWDWAALNISNGFLAILLPVLFLTISGWAIGDIVDYSERKR